MFCLQSLLLCFLPVYCHFEWAAGAAVKIQHSINAEAPGGVGAMLLQPGEGAPTERWLLTELRLGSSAMDGARAKPENGAIWRRTENLDSGLAAVKQSKALGKMGFSLAKRGLFRSRGFSLLCLGALWCTSSEEVARFCEQDRG